MQFAGGRTATSIGDGEPHVDHLRGSERERTACGRTSERRQRPRGGRDCSLRFVTGRRGPSLPGKAYCGVCWDLLQSSCARIQE